MMEGVTARRRSSWLLVLAFLVVPIVEIYVLIQVGQVIGALPTVLLLIADSIFGGWLIKREGGRAWAALRGALGEGRMPHRELADGALVVLGGALMLSPGFVTDIVGIALIIPVTRPFFRRILATLVQRRLITPPTRPSSGGRSSGAPGSGPGQVVPGEVVDRH